MSKILYITLELDPGESSLFFANKNFYQQGVMKWKAIPNIH